MDQSRFLRLAVVALLLLLLTGCHVTLEAGVDMHRDGGGVVRAGLGLDDEALRQVGDLAAELRVDDLRQTGWNVTGPRREGDGLTWVRASQGFSGPAAGERLIAQLSGPGGPFRDFRLSQSGSVVRTRTGFSGTVDLSAGLGGLSDPDLDGRIGGKGGIDLSLEGLKSRFGPDLSKVMTASVAVRLPGSVQTNAPERRSGRVVWRLSPGQSVAMRASARSDSGPVLVVAGLAMGAVLGALVMVVVRRRARRARRART